MFCPITQKDVLFNVEKRRVGQKSFIERKSLGKISLKEYKQRD